MLKRLDTEWGKKSICNTTIKDLKPEYTENLKRYIYTTQPTKESKQEYTVNS